MTRHSFLDEWGKVNHKDPYRRIAGCYNCFGTDAPQPRIVSDGLLPPLKTAGVDSAAAPVLFWSVAPKRAAVFGIDRSPSMLARAREKLDGSAGLYLGDAARMPYREGVFDLIAVSMALHERRRPHDRR